MSLCEKNNFVEISKNLAKYISKNNFVGLSRNSNYITVMLKKDKQSCKKFWYSNNQFERLI